MSAADDERAEPPTAPPTVPGVAPAASAARPLPPPAAPTDGGPGGAPAHDAPAATGGAGAEERPARPGARLVTLTMVVTTMIAGLVGYFLNGANVTASTASAAAQRTGVAASRQLLADQQQADADYQAYVQQRTEQQRATTAFVLGALAGPSPAATLAAARQAAATGAAAQTGTGVPADLGPDAPTGPQADPSFPQRLFTARAVAANELAAAQDGENEIAASWGAIGSQLTAALTVFAVALFLLGSSLSLRGRPRVLFSSLGATLVLSGLLWAMAVQLRPHQTSTNGEAAAHHYALGVQAASTAARPAEFQAAIDELDQAIALRPRFARAYFARAQAHIGHGNRELGPTLYVSQVDPDDLHAAIADLRAAARLGQGGPTEQNDLGAAELLDWLQSGHGNLAVASRQFRAAIAADPTSPLAYGNLAVTQLALGRSDEARTTFDQAIAQVLRPTGSAKPNEPFVVEQLLGASLSLLDNLTTSPAAADRGDLAAQVRAQKERLVASLGAGTLRAPAGAVTIDSFGPLVVNPDDVQVSFAPPAGFGGPGTSGADLAAHVVAVQWYFRSADDPRWTVVPTVSGWGTSDPAGAARSWNVFLGWSQGSYFVKRPFLGADCLPNGSYRAEVYVDGHLAGQTQGDRTLLGDLVQSRDPATGIALCHPADWRRATVPTVKAADGTPVALHGLLTGYSSADAAVYALRIPLPTDLDTAGTDADTPEQARAASATAYALALLAEAGLPHITGRLEAQQVLATDAYFMGTADTRSTLYTDGTTAAVVTAGAAGSDELVGVVVGPIEQVRTALGGSVNDLARVYYSLTRTA